MQAQTPVGKWISNLKYFDQNNYHRMELELNGDKFIGKLGGDTLNGTFKNGKIEAKVKPDPKQTITGTAFGAHEKGPTHARQK